MLLKSTTYKFWGSNLGVYSKCFVKTISRNYEKMRSGGSGFAER